MAKPIQKVKFVNTGNVTFFAVLRQRIDAHFKENNISKHGDYTMVIKTIILMTGYVLPFCIILTAELPFLYNMLLWVIMGLATSGIGMSVMHDANHGSYSSNKYVTYIVSHVLNMLGGSTFNWNIQHNIMHHTYTNIAGMDEDIEEKPLLRFSPHSKAKAVHRFQWIHAFLMYGLLTVYWVVGKDFVQYIKYKRNGVNTNTRKQNAKVLGKIILIKLVYVYVFLVMPTMVFGVPFLEMLTGFCTMHFLSGVILSVTFQLAHTVEGTSHPLPNANGDIENEWAIHQMNTTVNFCRNNKLISWYVGGLNFQVEHHLFPRISHIHYPAIAPIVKQTAEEFNVPYLENKTLMNALGSHVRTLQRLSVNETLVALENLG